jgi:hypothetical protein
VVVAGRRKVVPLELIKAAAISPFESLAFEITSFAPLNGVNAER